MGVRKTTDAITVLSLLSYEYYLLHGVFVVGSYQFFGRWPAFAIVASCIATLTAAWLLQQLVNTLRRLCKRSPVALESGVSGGSDLYHP